MIDRMKMFGLIVLVVLSCACATQSVVWTNANKDPSHFEQDNYRCVQESRMPWSASGLLWIAVMSASANHQASQLYRLCMQAAGYTEKMP